MASKAVTSAGTSEPLVASTAETLARFCSAVTIQYAGTNNIYGGTGSAAADVTSTVYEWTLNATDRSITIGDAGDDQNSVDLSRIRIDSDTSGQAVHYFMEQT